MSCFVLLTFFLIKHSEKINFDGTKIPFPVCVSDAGKENSIFSGKDMISTYDVYYIVRSTNAYIFLNNSATEHQKNKS